MEKSTGINDLKCNILLLGKSGAGKSSLCNYLFDKPGHFTSGKGKPVTNWEDNFQSHSFPKNGITIEVYDTVGLEVDNYTKWKKELNDFLSKHSSAEKNVSDWLHGIFYIINASSDRFEDVERDLIRSLLLGNYKESFNFQGILFDLFTSYFGNSNFSFQPIIQSFLKRDIAPPVQIVLTNCDSATDKQIQALTNELKSINQDIIIHQVNSITQKFRNRTSEAFGRDAVLDSFLNQAFKFINKSIALRVLDLVQITFKDMQHEINNSIDNFSVSIFKLNSFEEILENSINNLEEKIDALLDKNLGTIEEYEDLLDSFDIHYNGINYFDLVESAIDLDLDKLPSELYQKLESSVNKLEDGKFTEKVGAVITLGYSLIRVKKTLKTIVDETFDSFDKDFTNIRIDILSK